MIKICEHCGHKSVEYRFSFNNGLATFLSQLYKYRRPCKTDDLGLTYAQRTNSQKLRYWGLARSVYDDYGKLKRGVWQITQRGIDFVEHRIKIHKYVIMMNNKFVRYEGEEVFFNDVSEGYKYRRDYEKQSEIQYDMWETK